MDRPSGKALVAVLAAVGAAVGASAAVVWHVAVAGPSDGAPGIGVQYIRPSWFPVTFYLVGAGLAIGLVAASFLVDSGLRIVRDRERSRIHLFGLLIVVGAALGAGAALAWTHWPPQPTEVVVMSPVWPRYFETNGGSAGLHQSLYGAAIGEISVDPDVDTNSATIILDSDVVPSTFTPTIGDPWLVFPVGGVFVAALAALTLSLRDFRLTVVSRSDPDAV
ncbi:hypothetical protein BH92_02475 [Rhodococcoides fascians A21d2]|uniref:hypothetical protein n=1 Tax=Rhodococcoides fascians TaxID=1828 RepID=UPI000A573A0E|nr:hypothetical protein [Rhodococcus fascians]QIH98878.1 hypothetical protein BH92_02475 [Rhodococcus fascians A21d2]